MTDQPIILDCHGLKLSVGDRVSVADYDLSDYGIDPNDTGTVTSIESAPHEGAATEVIVTWPDGDLGHPAIPDQDACWCDDLERINTNERGETDAW